MPEGNMVTAAIPSPDAGSFEEKWQNVAGQIEGYCYNRVGSLADAADLLQEVAIKAWRAYPRFRGESSFATWAFRIAQNETSRFLERRGRQEAFLDSLRAHPPELIAAETAFPRESETDVGILLESAAEAGWLTEDQSKILGMRIEDSSLKWEAIAARLGIGASNAAVSYLRAIARLRVFFFIRRPDILGGAEAIEAAFLSTREELPDEQSLAFEYLVIKRDEKFRPAGWKGALTYACAAVIQHLHNPLF